MIQILMTHPSHFISLNQKWATGCRSTPGYTIKSCYCCPCKSHLIVLGEFSFSAQHKANAGHFLVFTLILEQQGRTQIQIQTRQQSFPSISGVSMSTAILKNSKNSFWHHSTRQLNRKYFLSKPTRSFLTPEVLKPKSKAGRLN